MPVREEPWRGECLGDSVGTNENGERVEGATGIPADSANDAEVTISEHVVQTEFNRDTEKDEDKPRAATVFHELSESYKRTTGGQDYGSAHQDAIGDTVPSFKFGDPRRGVTPGRYSGVRKI